MVLAVKLLDQSLQSPLHQRQLVGIGHRAGDIDQEDKVAGWPLVLMNGFAGDPDPGHAVFGTPGAAGDLEVDGERVAAAGCGRRILVREIIEHFLDANRVRGRKLVHLLQVAPDVGIAGCIDVDREGRQRLIDRPHEGILLNPVERFAVAARLLDREPEKVLAGATGAGAACCTG